MKAAETQAIDPQTYEGFMTGNDVQNPEDVARLLDVGHEQLMDITQQEAEAPLPTSFHFNRKAA
jgi:2-phospho-L-lactate guanylyltransferase (CobY/MobA/RfbA family)